MTRTNRITSAIRRSLCLAQALWIALLWTTPALAQSANDYRSRQSGTWGSASTWQRYTGSAWVNASATPTTSAGTITIRAGHTVTTANDISVDQFVVASGATLNLGKKLLVQNGAGIDMQVHGTIIANDRVQHLGFSTSAYHDGSFVDVQGAEFMFIDDSEADFYSGAVVDAFNKFQVIGDATVRLRGGSMLMSRSELLVANNGVLDVAGTIVNYAKWTLSGSAQVTFEDGGLYRHAVNGEAIGKVGLVTWESGSTCEITGATNSLPSEIGHSFHHLMWNSPSQNDDVDLDARIPAINGDFTVASTGSGSLSWVQSTNDHLVIGGRYVQTGGTFVYTDGTGTGTMDVAGDLDVSGGTLQLTTSMGAPTLKVGGDILQTGGTISAGLTGSATIVLDGTTAQAVAFATPPVGTISLTLDNASGATLGSPLDLDGDLTISNGTFDFDGNDAMLAGNLVVNGGLTNTGQFTFDGSASKSVSGSGSVALGDLVVDKSSGRTLTLTVPLDVTQGILASGGTFDLNDEEVTLKSVAGRTATLYENGGTVTGTAGLAIERYFGTSTDGWRMLAVPLTSVPYSTLNATFHTQGSAWGSTEAGPSNLRRLDVAAQDWVELDGADADFVPGEGYIFYMWAEDADGINRLPATWTVAGPLSSATSKPLDFNTTASDSHNLVGNPWASNLDWDATVAASTDIGTSYAVWDPAVTSGGGLSGYKYYNSAGGVGAAGPYIPPLQAFSVEATSASASLVFASSLAAHGGDPEYVGRGAAGTGPSPHVRFHLEGRGLAEGETYLVFDADAEAGRDPFDVSRLDPIAEDYVTGWFAAGEANRLAFDGRSLESGQESYDLEVTATRAGTYTLSWPDWHDIPDDWSLVLFDQTTGQEVDLRTRSDYAFHIGAAGDRVRFALRVTDRHRADPNAPFLPEAVRLAQNFPNPFTGSTTLRYALTEPSVVRLTVYDLLGRAVGTLVDGEQEAGWHTVSWEARGRPSGTYFYRLTVGSRVLTGRMIRL